jgi:succinoglycan biosynthesis protein ExoV
MQLYFFRPPAGNFGDDLNTWLWPRLVPRFAESTAADWLVGIGTILDERLLSLRGRLLILGTGYRPTG